MITQILVPLDGSTLAERALPYAQHLALLTGATLHLARVVDMFQYARWSPFPPTMAPDNVEGLLNAEAATAHAYLHAAPMQVAAVHVTESIAETLLAYARVAHIGLVVMASHRRRGALRARVGGRSTAAPRPHPAAAVAV